MVELGSFNAIIPKSTPKKERAGRGMSTYIKRHGAYTCSIKSCPPHFVGKSSTHPKPQQ